MAFAIAGSTALAIGVTAAGAGALAGGISAIGSNKRRKSREKELDDFAQQSPLYQGSKPISEYYQQAMNRYKESPYQSQQYQLGAMNARRATAQGLGALQDRRSAIGGISRLEAGQNAAMQNLGAQAEAQRDARFSQLGGATQMKNADLLQQFDINKMTPYNRQFGLKQMKSAAANEEYAKDVSNTFSSLSNLASVGMMAGQKTPDVPTTGTGLSAENLAKNDATLNNFFATRDKINPNFIPNSRGITRQNSTFMNDMSKWNKARSLGG